MALSYEPLWDFLNKMGISKMEFAKRIGISNATLAKIGKNEPITLTIIEKICSEFNCNINNIVVHIKDDQGQIPGNMLNIGTVVECSCISSLNAPFLSDIKRIKNVASKPEPCVIIRKGGVTRTNSELLLIAPLSFKKYPEFILDIPFTDASINNSKMQGYIQLSRLSDIDSKYVSKISGHLTRYFVEYDVNSIILDLAPILEKNHLINFDLLKSSYFDE